jgi:hypothetical protein
VHVIRAERSTDIRDGRYPHRPKCRDGANRNQGQDLAHKSGVGFQQQRHPRRRVLAAGGYLISTGLYLRYCNACCDVDAVRPEPRRNDNAAPYAARYPAPMTLDQPQNVTNSRSAVMTRPTSARWSIGMGPAGMLTAPSLKMTLMGSAG